MSMLTRSITLGVLALGVGATALAAQQKPRGYSNYRWYIGAQGSYFNFQTTGQTRGWIPSVGGNTMIIAKRTGLLISVDDALGNDEVATIDYAGSATGTQQVAFNDDTNGSLNSALDYVPSATGDVFVEAKSFNDTATGAYHLSVTATELPPDAVGNDASTRARISSGMASVMALRM